MGALAYAYFACEDTEFDTAGPRNKLSLVFG